jgi:hypothetical protein
MRVIFLLFSFYFSLGLNSQNDSIRVHFLYGSKPLKKYKNTEAKFFGGLHGGHVSIEIDHVDYGFEPKGKFHILPHRKSCHSAFITRQTNGRNPYTDKDKVVTFIIPVTPQQHDSLFSIMNSYCFHAPYDYAFFGMRCAAATQDILGKTGILKPKGKLSNVATTFYPKKLRKRMYRLSKEKNYRIIFHEGRKTRKWEKD